MTASSWLRGGHGLLPLRVLPVSNKIYLQPLVEWQEIIKELGTLTVIWLSETAYIPKHTGFPRNFKYS